MGRGIVAYACWSTEAAIFLKLVKIHVEEKLQWTAYRNSPMLFLTVPFPNPTALLSLDWRFATLTQDSDRKVSYRDRLQTASSHRDSEGILQQLL